MFWLGVDVVLLDLECFLWAVCWSLVCVYWLRVILVVLWLSLVFTVYLLLCCLCLCDCLFVIVLLTVFPCFLNYNLWFGCCDAVCVWLICVNFF